MTTVNDEGLAAGEDGFLETAARTAVADCLAAKAGERFLIVTNPGSEVLAVSRALYDAAAAAGALPLLLVQPEKTQLDEADPAVLAAIATKPEIVASISSAKLGKDGRGIAAPYRTPDGRSYDHIFHYLRSGTKEIRAFWSPGTTREMFGRTVPIDYRRMRESAAILARLLDRAVSARVTSQAGTEVRFGLCGRLASEDTGDYSQPGSGGNLPAGEVFISPELGTAEGIVAFQGSISVIGGEILLPDSVFCSFEKGFVVRISGGTGSERLEEALGTGKRRALDPGAGGPADPVQAAAYAANARNLGEFGIGLNPAARVRGLMLEDEKVLSTCHFAIGANYDGDAPALIHLDGLVPYPTVELFMEDGCGRVVMENGRLLI